MWTNFQQRHESRDAAFEALCCQLFERWCRREYGDSIRSFYFVDGRGGDGGVEAFAILDDESVIGLQAKAFWGGFKGPQKTQVAKSLQSAKNRHPTLKRYIVCFPLDPSGSKGARNQGTSELDRWQTLEAESETTFPDVALEYRGENGIREWLQQPDSDTINAYWFDREVVPREHWRTQFERIESAWLNLRYVPDLHVSTILDEHLSWFVNSPESATELKVKISRLSDSLVEKRDRIADFENLPVDHSEQALSDCAALVDAIDASLVNLRMLLAAAESQYLPAIEGTFSVEPGIWNAVSRLLQELGGKDRLQFEPSATRSVSTSVDRLQHDLGAVRDLLKRQQLLRRTFLVLGEAGTGKTQTVTKLCDNASSKGLPVLVLPARAYGPNDDWTTILSGASSLSEWTADEILDAMEASALLAWRESPEPRSAPRRAILALDGPDEDPSPEKWAERITEFADLCKSRHLIAPIVTTRPESESWLDSWNERFHTLRLEAPDLADHLPEIFQAYIDKYDITVPSPDGVAWALRTPFAIRAFAEIYQGQTIAPGQDFVTTLSELFKEKFRRIDRELNLRTSSWRADREFSLQILLSLVPIFLEERKCPYERFAESVNGSLNRAGATVENAAALFERSANGAGLIEIRKLRSEGMTPDQIVVRPGFSALLDYLLATKVTEKLKIALADDSPDPNPEDVLPTALRYRSNAASLVVAMLLKEGVSILDSGHWESLVERKDLEAWHARAISDLPADQGMAHIGWVSAILRRNMTSCRMVVAELILPSCRVPGAAFGAEFLHQEFKQMSMTERDLVWSGPDWLPHNCDAPWEGDGIPVHDSITLRDDDSADSAPILVAWSTSSVIQERKRQAIARLAMWGAKRPSEFANLLRRFAKIDDVQVVESVAVAAVGAVLELVEHGKADGLARATHEIFFENREEKDHPSVVARHAARLVIERSFRIGTDLPETILQDATPPYPAVGAKLSIDLDAILKRHEHPSPLSLSIDLDSYVAKEAIDPFFKHKLINQTETEERNFRKVPETILDAAVEGRLGVNETVRAEIVGEIETRAENQGIFNIDPLSLLRGDETTIGDEEETSDSDDDEADPVEERSLEELIKALHTPAESPSPPSFGPEADALLADYVRDLPDIEQLNPKQFGDGLIVALVREWGWNEKTFYGHPDGERPGEILGADIAILRTSYPATHGSRSSIAMFAEKYIWSAVNVVSSFLCDRLPGEVEWDSELELIANQSELGSGMPDPLSGLRPDTTPEFRPPWAPEGIAPTPELSVTRQPNRGIQWLERAEWPNPEDWLMLGSDDAILLSGFLLSSDHRLGIQLAVWVSCFAVPRAQLPLIERDVKLAPDLWTGRSLHELEGHFGGGFYAPPRLAVWTPWSEDSKSETWDTLEDSGEPVEIPISPLVTKALWDGTEGETSARSPSKLLREAGEIIDCRGPDSALQFVNRDREEVAYYQRMSFPDDWSKSNQYLQIQRSLLFRALTDQDLVPVWGVRLYRELLPELRLDGNWVDQDSYWMVIPEEDSVNFRSKLVWRGSQKAQDES